jgi:hypothetical protein
MALKATRTTGPLAPPLCVGRKEYPTSLAVAHFSAATLHDSPPIYTRNIV